MNKVVRTERGWAGHFICADDCRFRRNTLLQYGNTEVVVSTVGLMKNALKVLGKSSEPFTEIGHNRYYETMAFRTNPNDTRYHDADVTKQISFSSPWCIGKVDADDRANNMHEVVVTEITARLKSGELREDCVAKTQ